MYWCAADVGWVTGHSYIVYGPLANGATSVMYEGTPDTPAPSSGSRDDPASWSKDRLWDIIERYGVTQLYTAPTAIRTFMKWGDAGARAATTCRRCGCSARWASRSTPRRGCGTTPTSAAARCPIVDTWWQTETGGHMITPLPGITETKPGSACRALPGIARRAGGRRRATGRARRRLPDDHPAVAVDAARHLG